MNNADLRVLWLLLLYPGEESVDIPWFDAFVEVSLTFLKEINI